MPVDTNHEIRLIKKDEFHNHSLLSRLLELHDIPEQLYIRGTLPTITLDEYGRATPRILTVVGSRKHTTYGKLAAEKLLTSLAEHNVIILSGLALGIDGIAHHTALTNKILTIAAPGSDVGRSIYPSTHRHMAEDIVNHGGLLISELAEGAPIARWTFPARNRIMAALADAVLIVEAGEKSGTLVTARQALELGRDIGAVPGEILSPTSAGSNTLIRDGAYPITGGDDLLELLHLTKKEIKDPSTAIESFTKEEQSILQALTEPTSKDTLLTSSSLPLEIFLTTFSTLEIKGAVEETFGEVRRIV